jgi:hypothetical protein
MINDKITCGLLSHRKNLLEIEIKRMEKEGAVTSAFIIVFSSGFFAFCSWFRKSIENLRAGVLKPAA